ncbi:MULTISPECIES: photosystem II protein Y [Moorena]|uniref:Photosystem II reaction center protein Y n=1 Tax=Moorena producens PAL-8-15-08-1 TaxID=1458985 RepID=A0A1D8TXD4_9CYAN|nr:MULTISPECIES: photosystem II protein Y [Moorena]AOX02319.1 photosystem II protein [Moorena producens PAL-8-15-08-1]NEO72522.1 photosystem II protein Y [Moorena sp. SIO3H5]NEO76897.1 photosystem II protein Y [Moorena sp. SIO4G3]
MDLRLLIVLLPLLLALGWVAYNIGAIALKQAQNYLNRSQ